MSEPIHINHEIMYTLGQIVRVVYPCGDPPSNILQQILARPVTGLGMLTRTVDWQQAMQRDDENLMRLFDKLPNNLDTKSAIPSSIQGGFWLGYYQYVSAINAANNLQPWHFAEAGKVLFGDHWQQAMADTLKLSGTARIRSWLKGKLKIPSSVWQEVIVLLKQRNIQLETISKIIEQTHEDEKGKD